MLFDSQILLISLLSFLRVNLMYKKTLIDGVNIPLDTMSGEWYEVIKSKPKEVTFHIAENTTQETRQLILTITGIGMSYDDITITQE